VSAPTPENAPARCASNPTSSSAPHPDPHDSPTPPPRRDDPGLIPTSWRATRAGSAWDTTPAGATCGDCGGRHATPADAIACDQLVSVIRGD